ncbi:baseplate wedge subunit [Acinetobacter phage ZZ1]|jgi:hypothetical protein|uniref:Baseplate wedge subunit and tail pin n=3 Tax=Caudoviricetes TaxID=2731619 RepID=A0A410T5U3_9CAUD|nr:baseplate wedge subunit [Acinetobacter phage ZZ1]AEJ90223.1 baseplate wedge subunit and tail pin [Acinetobacter phage ZZ1]QAU04024.1 baseplate wedge subunit and tail pin [Acinetobacter phage Henu6]
MSKNFQLAQNFSREASHHEFDVKKGSIIVGNNQPIGSPSISQSQKGIKVPNVEDAINDVASLTILPLNTIIINDDGNSPQGISQIDEFKFIGSIKDPSKQTGDEVKFDFYGFVVPVKIGDNAEEVAAKVKLELDLAKSAGIVFNRVENGATLDILQLTYNDVQSHELDDLVQYTMRVTQNTVSPARGGYGIWNRIGTQTITLDGTTKPTILYYFKREG